MAEAWTDISIPIRDGMIHWPGDPPVEVQQTAWLERGDPAAVRRLSFGTHTGTHVDAPLHVLAGGLSVDRLPLGALSGPARVIAVAGEGAISPEALDRALDGSGIGKGERILLRTRNSDVRWYERPFREDFVYLSPDAAGWLAERQVGMVGVDYLSVGGFGEEGKGPEIHRHLLSAGVLILEGLYLGEVAPGRCDLMCLPLRVDGGDGAPARAAVRTLKA